MGLPKKPYCYRHLRKLLELDEKLRRTLIRNFEFESIHAAPVDAIRNIDVPVLANVVDTCCAYAIGHAKEQADALIRKEKVPAAI